MNEVLDFFKGLFETKYWPARWHCGQWSDFHGWLYIVSDLMIWLAYFLIPVIIFSYVSKRKQVIKYPRIYLLFAAFILLCGSTHFLDACMFWIPMYRLNALVRFLTAVVSLATVYSLVKLLPGAFKEKTNIELEREVNRRETAELQLAEANKNLEAFAFVASHDLQEPLRKIKIFSSMLYDSNQQNFSPESRKLANKIQASTDRMQTLIHDVLRLSTISDDMKLAPVSIQDVVKDVQEDLEIKIAERQAQIVVGEIPMVSGNYSYLTQLFINLISNGIKFNTGTPVISISGETIGSRVYISVSDNGIGINEGDARKIFEAFTRLNSRSEFEGSGIGLTICRRIVLLHHGTISVQSKAGEGSTFTFDLPALEPVETV